MLRCVALIQLMQFERCTQEIVLVEWTLTQSKQPSFGWSLFLHAVLDAVVIATAAFFYFVVVRSFVLYYYYFVCSLLFSQITYAVAVKVGLQCAANMDIYA